jgi:hypothetical protein
MQPKTTEQRGLGSRIKSALRNRKTYQVAVWALRLLVALSRIFDWLP